MPILDLDAFAAALPPAGALLGLDPGTKRVGVATSDPGRTIATAIDTVPRGTFAQAAERIFALYDARAGAGMVIGLPLNLDGSTGPSAQAARAFARNIAAFREIPVFLWDERLSTSAVTRQLIAEDATRRQRAAVVDKLAAAYMLQGALDRLKEFGARAGFDPA